jgi:hypothetical protein
MLRRARAGDWQAIVDRVGAAAADFCAISPKEQKVVYCYETDGPQICGMVVVESAELRDDQDVLLYEGPAVEVSMLQPYQKPANYPDPRSWLDIMFELMAFTFDRLVAAYPEAADLRPYATLPSSATAQAWKSRLANFGNVQIKALADGRALVYWGGGGTVRKLLNVLG